jgi:hypothetical protein
VSAPSKAAAGRRGYLRALLDVENEIERFQAAISFVVDAGGVTSTPRLDGARDAFRRMRSDVLNRVRDARSTRR